MGVLPKMFLLLILWSIPPDNVNPCRGVKRFKEQKREHYNTAEEHHRLGQTFADARSAVREAINAFQLLLILAAAFERTSA
ncbi:hypothetical protein [Acetobacter persici]|uniref:hypothetical protein n=1 Tax=Acetobacter persici TaxID=1076596 RepID=UPI0020128AC5|nr:hypothetical protein [Acetobacter persici]